MSLHKKAMEAVLEAAEKDIQQAMDDNKIEDPYSEEADDIVFDVAILHAYRIFVRICEKMGFTPDAALFAEMASDLADEIARSGDDEEDEE